MAKPARARRKRERTVAGRHHEDTGDLVRRTLGRRAGRGEPRDGDVTVQLLPHLIASGEMSAVVVGREIEVAPAIYTAGHLPALSERETWTVDEFGCFDGRGALITAPLENGGCSCRVDVLDVDGRLFPVNWAASVPGDGRLWVEGALYLDPELASGTEHGEAVALCRRRYLVREIRRYRRTAYRPADPVRLDAVPAPDDVNDDAVYVADLRLVDDVAAPSLAAEGVVDRSPG
ncbi:hypothetical protein [Actinomycetospora flava]|uniref:Uncharacterized protein n=1 Tax=Actinomycetospora flava TaxID=3129232 RepID=A0ABU8M691_9PSEU